MHKLHTSVSVDCAACSAAQLRLVVVYWATPLSYKLLYLQVHTVHFSALKLNAVSSCPPSNTSENKLRLLCSFWKHGSKKRNSKHACELILNPFAQVYDTYTHKHKHTHTHTQTHTTGTNVAEPETTSGTAHIVPWCVYRQFQKRPDSSNKITPTPTPNPRHRSHSEEEVQKHALIHTAQAHAKDEPSSFSVHKYQPALLLELCAGCVAAVQAGNTHHPWC